MVFFILKQPWLITGLACFAAIFAALVYDIHRESPLKKTFHAYDIPTTLKETKAQHSMLPEQQNGITLLREAIEKIKHPDEILEKELPDIDEYNWDLDIGVTPQERDAVKQLLVLNAQPLKLVFEAMTYPHIQYPMDIISAGSYAYDNFNLIYLVLCAALDAALSGDEDALNQAMIAGFRLTLVSAEIPMNTEVHPLVYSCNRFLRAFEYILAVTNPERETLLAWRDIAADNTYRNYRIHQQISRNVVASYFLSRRYIPFPSYYMAETDIHAVIPRMILEWTDCLNNHELLFVQDAIDTISAGEKDISDIIEYHGNFANSRSHHFLFLSMYSDPAGGNEFLPPYTRYAKVYATASLAHAALSVRLYYYDHGYMPDTLNDLMPNYLKLPPRDPFSYQPIMYRIEEDIAVFYSVGEDGVYGENKEKDCNCNDDIEFRLKIPKKNMPLDPPSEGDLKNTNISSTGGQTS